MTALGFVTGVGVGAALAARLRGRNVLEGRRCAKCGASLSVVRRVPLLSWLGVLPRCRRCGTAAGWLHPALETGAMMIGLLAIFTLPPIWAFAASFVGWVLFVAMLRRWG